MIEERTADGQRARRHAADAALLAIVAAVAALALAQSWRGWLDPIVDTGRDLYIPEQIRHGVRLYRDVIYYYPPFTPYLLALITAVTGSSLAAYAGIGITVAAATAATLFFAGRISGGREAGFTAALLFAACSIAGRSTWGTNYLFPYSHAATFATLLFVALVGCLLTGRREVPEGTEAAPAALSPAAAFAALAFAFLACWTKLEFVLFTVIVLAVALATGRLRLRWVAAWVVASAASVGAVFFLFRDNPPGRHWLFDNVAPSTLLRSPYLKAFYDEVTGLAHWPMLLARSAAGALNLVAVVALLAAAERVERRWMRALCYLAAAAGAALLLRDDLFWRSWTVLQIALVPFAARRPREPLLLLLAASLCTTSRVFFQLVPVWYGFVFVVPLYLLIGYLFFAWLPERGVLSRRTSRALLLLIGAVALQSLVAAHGSYGGTRVRLATDRGVLDDPLPWRVAAIERLRGDVTRFGIRELVVLPEGLALNYLLGVPTPIAYYTFTPPEAADPQIESRILGEFEAKRPEWIAFVPRDVSEFGATAFGIDYDRRLMAYIRSRYRVADVIREHGFTIVLLVRGDRSSRPH